MLLNRITKILVFVLILILNIIIGALLYSALLKFGYDIGIFIVIYPIITFFINYLVFAYILNASIKTYIKSLAEKFTSLSLSKNLMIEHIEDEKNLQSFTDELYSSVLKLKENNKKISDDYFELKEKINNFIEELDSFKKNNYMEYKNGISNSSFIKKMTEDLNDSILEKEGSLKNSKIIISNAIDIINEKNKNKNKIFDSLNKLAIISRDFDKIFNSIKSFTENVQGYEDKIILRATEIITNLERQSINILNAYIFSNPESKSVVSDDNESSEIDKEENLQNIKKMNDSLKAEIYNIKNIFVALFEANKIFREELNRNTTNIFELKSAILRIPDNISGFYEVYNNIKTELQNDVLTIDKMIEKIGAESETLKNINIKLNTISKSIEDTNMETVKLKFE